MKASKVHLVVLGLLIHVTSTRPYAPQCSSIKNKPCTTHSDCRCLFSLFLCSLQNACQKATPGLISSLASPCPGVFKHPCLSNADCKCETQRLKCEENECVRDKRKIVGSKDRSS